MVTWPLNLLNPLQLEMREDDIFYFISAYGIWILLALAIVKFLYLLLYRHSVDYAFRKFFIIYTDKRIVKDDSQRYNFRLVHNTLTWLMYGVFFLWLIVRLIIME